MNASGAPRVAVAPVLRRPSPLDPAPGSWAVIGLGDHGGAVLAALLQRGIPAVGYDGLTDPAPGDDATVAGATLRTGHVVVAVEEIDDIDALAVTSFGLAESDLTTDYFAGVVFAVGSYRDWSFVDPEMLNVVEDTPVLAHRMFTPRHPAIAVSGPDVTADLADQAAVIAAYADRLRMVPRQALAFHRQACSRLLPGFPRLAVDPVADQDYATVLEADLRLLDT